MSLMMHVFSEKGRTAERVGEKSSLLPQFAVGFHEGALYLILTADAWQEETYEGNKPVTERACALPRDPQPPHTELKIKQMELEELFFCQKPPSYQNDI